MTQILWHGRGGQGAFTAARILGAAYVSGGDGRYALAFPAFGPERRGAPMRAFAKLSGAPIHARSEIKTPDFTVFLDGTLFTEPSETGVTLVNSPLPLRGAVTIDAGRIAASFSIPTPNTAMLGALAALLGIISPREMELGVAAVMPERLRARNTGAIRAANEFVCKGGRP
ncbi:MAG: 2-oxoacid:acceptor oxidoreductase family protein [Oscillospiraceae bacterium]|jgi:pyruvate ferredoxin oxidoreductase gamma subunit|nr:2-oxoacid:acceptor oxidoreductase family protein [Oscillospiraceae bacterium]